MTLRAKLTLAFALFAALPMLIALWPVSRALSEALDAEYDARLEAAARAVEGEVRRAGEEASAAARELARSAEVEALARDRELGLLEPAEAAARAGTWMAARALDVLALTDARGEVLSSGHLPGRAGDVDPDLAGILAAVPAGRAVPRVVTRAVPPGLERALALVAWEPVPGTAGPLRLAAGIALGPRFAERLAALTGGEVALRAEGASRPVRASPGGATAPAGLARLLGITQARARSIPVPGGEDPLARIDVTLPATGLARAQARVVVAFLAALAAAVLAATALGHLLARRITRPLEALRTGALEVARGNLEARVEAAASGEVGELVGAFNAMTADLARITARAAAAERVAAWREVARRLAHEVKNPLTPVAMSVETLRDAWARQRPDFGELFDEGTRAIREEVRRLARIVDEFGRFARLPAPELGPVPAAELLASLLALYPTEQGEVRIERGIPADLPQVAVDRDQMLQVLHNLVRNALDAVGARGTVRVAARLEGGELAISVSDTGPGIRSEDLPHLFEPYFTTKQEGTGLGLAIADRIVREHGGRIEAASPPGGGATFTVRLPAVPGGSPSAPGSP